MLTKEQVEAVMKRTDGNVSAAARLMGVPRGTFRDFVQRLRNPLQQSSSTNEPSIQMHTSDNDCILTLRSATIRTLEDAILEGKVDESIWEVDHWVLNKWDCVANVASGSGVDRTEQLEATELWQVKVWLRRKTPEVRSLEELLKKLEESGPVRSKDHKKIPKGSHRRCLEIALADPHLGLQCFTPESSASWGLDECEKACLWAIEALLDMAKAYAPIEQVVLPFGNDFLHSDNVFNTTTAGTPQPEAMSWHEVYLRGEELAIRIVEMVRKVAPVKIYEIPGNHARHTEFTLGRVLRAYYHNDAGVEVDASPSPYKFHRFGTNLIGYEHGHSIQPIRLAAIMANECADIWGQTTYREWHLGDQHRKGTSKPSSMEEQGVAVEYLPSLVAPNAWHKLKGFSGQQRSCLAFVWDHDTGPAARLQVNLPSMKKKARR